jgi:endonuclease/exonuclease/phosphatase family metal-dependent hydrolase
MPSAEERLRATHRWAVARGFFHGWPNFEEANYHDGRGVVYGSYLLRPGDHIEWRDVLKRELGAPDLSNVEGCWRAVHRWAVGQGFATGMPTFEQADHGSGVVYGTVLLKHGPQLTWQDVPRAELDDRPGFKDPGGVIRSINRWATRHGFAAGFPTFEQADHRDGRGVVYGSFGLAAGDYLHWQDVPAHELGFAPPPTNRVRVMAWNIFEGERLPDIIKTIQDLPHERKPDIVLLNEVRWFAPGFGPSDQTAWLAAKTGFPHFHYGMTTQTGIVGTKGVAILSRYPLSHIRMHMATLNGRPTTFGSLRATIRIDDLDHEVFSTRFAPMHKKDDPAYDPEHEPGNRNGHLEAIDLVQAIPPDRAVIFGGDLNAPWDRPWAKEFHDKSGLADVLEEQPDPEVPIDLAGRVDYIYYRGPYKVAWTRMGEGHFCASDHRYVLTELTRTSAMPGREP